MKILFLTTDEPLHWAHGYKHSFFRSFNQFEYRVEKKGDVPLTHLCVYITGVPGM